MVPQVQNSSPHTGSQAALLAPGGCTACRLPTTQRAGPALPFPAVNSQQRPSTRPRAARPAPGPAERSSPARRGAAGLARPLPAGARPGSPSPAARLRLPSLPKAAARRFLFAWRPARPRARRGRAQGRAPRGLSGAAGDRRGVGRRRNRPRAGGGDSSPPAPPSAPPSGCSLGPDGPCRPHCPLQATQRRSRPCAGCSLGPFYG